MPQFSLSFDSSLLVRDVAGDYRPAKADEVLQAAQRVLLQQLHASEALTSPELVRDFLRVKLGTLQHEIFAMLMLDLCAAEKNVEWVEQTNDGEHSSARSLHINFVKAGAASRRHPADQEPRDRPAEERARREIPAPGLGV